MRYTKGIKGPESTNDVDIQYANQTGPENNPMTTGVAMLTTAKGVRAVSLLAQGKNSRALHEAIAKTGKKLRLKVRWTGRDAVTVTGVAA